MNSHRLTLPKYNAAFSKPTLRPGSSDLVACVVLVLLALTVLSFAFRQPPTFAWGQMVRPEAGPSRQDLFLDNFYPAETATGPFTTKHWSTGNSAILFPSMGRGGWQATLVLNGQRPNAHPPLVTLTDGQQSLTIPLAGQPRFYSILTGAPSGDWSVRLRTSTFVPQQIDPQSRDDRTLGVILNHIALAPVKLSALPPTSAYVWIIGAVLLAYGAMRAAGLRAPVAVTVPLVLLLFIAIGLLRARLAMGVFLPRLFGATMCGALAIPIARWTWRRLLRLGSLRAPESLLTALLLIFFLGYMIKVAGVIYPYTVTIDVPWHMQHTRDILNGRLAELYKPGAFSESVMPTQEWGNQRPLIPYSPFFHIFATIFAIFPWKLETSANVLSVLADTSRGFLIAALALKFGWRARVAALAALLYAITPFTFLLHSWGNIPTTFGMWWSLIATTVIVLGWERLAQRRVWVLMTVVLLLTFLFYTVVAVFTGLFLLLLLAGLSVWRIEPRGSARALGTAFVAAMVAALVIYYGQYIPPMIQRTLPYVMSTIVEGHQNAGQANFESLGTASWHTLLITGYYNRSQPLWYGIALPLFFGIPGIALLRRNRLALLIVLSWLAVAILFFLLATRLSMVDKHIFYIAPALVLTGAAALNWLWERYKAFGVIIGLSYLGTFVSALLLWLMRLQRVAL